MTQVEILLEIIEAIHIQDKLGYVTYHDAMAALEELEKLQAERDAAVADMREVMFCEKLVEDCNLSF